MDELVLVRPQLAQVGQVRQLSVGQSVKAAGITHHKRQEMGSGKIVLADGLEEYARPPLLMQAKHERHIDSAQHLADVTNGASRQICHHTSAHMP